MNFSGPLEDRILIRELCEQYCDGVMRKDTTTWGATWTEDAEWILSDENTLKGREAIVADAAKIMNSYSVGTFFCNLGSTHVDGSRATGRCYHVEFFSFATGPAWYLSCYDDEYIKSAGRWYFKKRVFTLRQQGTV